MSRILLFGVNSCKLSLSRTDPAVPLCSPSGFICCNKLDFIYLPVFSEGLWLALKLESSRRDRSTCSMGRKWVEITFPGFFFSLALSLPVVIFHLWSSRFHVVSHFLAWFCLAFGNHFSIFFRSCLMLDLWQVEVRSQIQCAQSTITDGEMRALGKSRAALEKHRNNNELLPRSSVFHPNSPTPVSTKC